MHFGILRNDMTWGNTDDKEILSQTIKAIRAET